ncbi:MAG TPA: Minf_1886 family protein [Phycisphaerae bacterium]|nr:Minf_1886 family protein [Phycisphaerae bacterium]
MKGKENKPDRSMEEVILADGRYPPEAYAFLHDGLAHTVRQVHGEEKLAAAGEESEAGDAQLHVTGKQLCEALRDLAIERWGLLARTVLAKWNLHATVDFGNMVYVMIEHGSWRKTEEDSIEDFRDVYDFETAFDVTDEFELKE